MGNLRHVAYITSAATTEDAEPGRPVAHSFMLLPKFHWIAVIKGIARFEFCMTLARGVTKNPPDAMRPVAVFQKMREKLRMSTIHHEIGNPKIGRFVHGLNRVLK